MYHRIHLINFSTSQRNAPHLSGKRIWTIHIESIMNVIMCNKICMKCTFSSVLYIETINKWSRTIGRAWSYPYTVIWQYIQFDMARINMSVPFIGTHTWVVKMPLTHRIWWWMWDLFTWYRIYTFSFALYHSVSWPNYLNTKTRFTHHKFRIAISAKA